MIFSEYIWHVTCAVCARLYIRQALCGKHALAHTSKYVAYTRVLAASTVQATSSVVCMYELANVCAHKRGKEAKTARRIAHGFEKGVKCRMMPAAGMEAFARELRGVIGMLTGRGVGNGF
jgi:hypothetical protein